MIDVSVDHYAILGVSMSSTIDEIKKAYRKGAMKWHPDRNPDNIDKATIEISKINTAWSILGNPDKKNEYDAARSSSRSGSSRRGRSTYDQEYTSPYNYPGSKSNKKSSNPYTGADGFSFDSDLWGRTSKETQDDYDAFSEALKKATNSSDEWARYRDYANYDMNEDSEIKLSISLKDAFFGKVLNVTYTTSTNETKTVKVSIPAGITSGKKLKCSGGGCSLNKSSDPGDLYITIDVLIDTVFVCDNLTLTYSASVTPFDLMLGSVLTVPTIDGTTLEVQLRAGMQPGTKIRIPNKGMSSLHGDKRGDMFISLSVIFPEILTSEQTEALYLAKKIIYS